MRRVLHLALVAAVLSASQPASAQLYNGNPSYGDPLSPTHGGTGATGPGGTALDNVSGLTGVGILERTGPAAYTPLPDPLSPAHGGTGTTSLSTGQLIAGGGTGPFTTVPNGQLPATATNDNASAGHVGEYISSVVPSTSAVALTNNTPANVTSITLTPGDWDIFGSVAFVATGTPVAYYGGANLTSAALPGQAYQYFAMGSTGIAAFGAIQAIPFQRLSLSTTTTVYLVAESGIGSGATSSAYGFIGARRAR